MARILVDASIWIDHLRHKDDHLIKLLQHNQVLVHSMTRGELACGCLHNRAHFLSLLSNLPKAAEATHDEVFFCLENHKLVGKGVGFIDLHLLASTLLSKNALLWTRDRHLQNLARLLNVSWNTSH
jgi:predicted nucleic acid-binding protein